MGCKGISGSRTMKSHVGRIAMRANIVGKVLTMTAVSLLVLSFGSCRQRNSDAEIVPAPSFTTEALDTYMRDEYFGTPDGPVLVRHLASETLSGSGTVAFSGEAGNSHTYYIGYMCKQSAEQPVSISLSRGDEDRRLIMLEACVSDESAVVSLPVGQFPEADSVLVETGKQTSLIVTVYEGKESQ